MHKTGIYIVLHGTGLKKQKFSSLFNLNFAAPLAEQEFDAEIIQIDEIKADIYLINTVPQEAQFINYLYKVAHAHIVIFDTIEEEESYVNKLFTQLQITGGEGTIYASQYVGDESVLFTLPETKEVVNKIIKDLCTQIMAQIQREKQQQVQVVEKDMHQKKKCFG
ncbi:Hypothetical_protein [Hexamita inflata]|uniref:Hypothetical_protein n=1 Tax=Hexamita inflata TaxID=28002 RepID=A0AA86NJK0_9EUKA|nr:Hypothetical protein HINF_LOCUS2211 [Hexamita inflata]CAI9921154.1 Hypothetical protein HINF_LOCUS8799 [Hexamita inflata]